MATLVLIGAFLLPAAGFAAMESASYVIYENVMHAFDGPVISGVGSNVSGITATVSWTTNVASDSYVIYSTDSGLAGSKEQGTSAKAFTAHEVELSGLAANTTYYYRVRSERVNGGVTTDGTTRSFATGADPDAPDPAEPGGGGGGMLIIDKTDKAAPEIWDVAYAPTAEGTAAITWETNEEATSFVEYGTTAAYGSAFGLWSTSTSHRVELKKLEPDTLYHYRVLSSDGWGNVGRSADATFTTGPAAGQDEEEPAADEPETPLTDENGRTALAFLTRVFPQIRLDQLPGIANFEEFAGLFVGPTLTGEPEVEIQPDRAIVRWGTDLEANGLVAIAPESAYAAGTDEPYQMVVGNPEVYGTAHEVTLFGLTPDTTYHFQLRSKTPLGPTAVSGDNTFRTSIETLQIVSYLTQVVDNETAVFKWVTNKEADSSVTFTPYFEGQLAVDQAKTIKDNSVSVVHELPVAEFVGGTVYQIEIASADAEGNTATKVIAEFSTTDENLPPIISEIKAESTVFVDRSNKIQTVISWLTNEPATSRVRFQEGVVGGDAELAQSTDLNENYTKEHVMVITDFKPGLVYSFRVESVDSGDNRTVSKVHTFMTAKKKESIITIILGILENTFGWLKKIV